MIGCDIVKVSRFKKNFHLWINKILTEEEKIEIEKRKNKLEYLAGRWAAKESTRKLLGTSFDISILNKDNGSPYIKEHPNISVSISHEKNYCIAVVLNSSKQS